MIIGDIVPNFEAQNQYGDLIKLSDYKNKKLIIFFYPKANTPGCTAQACNLRDGYQQLKDKGYELLGISADAVGKQFNFSNKYQFPFSILSDENKNILKLFGVWGEKKFMGKTFEGIHRKTFVLDENHSVVHIIDKVKTKEHTKQLLEIL